VKAAAKPAAKMPAKTSAKAVAVKPATAKPTAVKAVVSAKAPAKVAPKPVAKPAAKPVTKPVVSVAKAPAAAKPAAKAPTKAAAVPTALAKTAVVKQAPAKAAPVVAAKLAAVPAPAAAARSKVPTSIRTVGKTNAKVAPSMASDLNPTVASTAAKSSYKASSLPVMPSPVFAVSAPTKKDPKLANNWKNKPVDKLTDAEVLAMSDDDYMNDAQMAFFKLKLSQLKQEILSSASETTEHLREDTVVVPDPTDRATIEEEHALELRTRDRERKLLKKIEQSIARIDGGDYGYCDETGEPIGVGRLLARPTANLSLEAQQRRELKQKMFGD
jgi:DnaK suppressor protein